MAAAATAMSLQSCPTLCDPINGSPPGSPIPVWQDKIHVEEMMELESQHFVTIMVTKNHEWMLKL